MSLDWLFAVYYILALEGLGLVILGTRVKNYAVVLQGFLQLATGLVGACIELSDREEDYGLLWLLFLFIVLTSKWVLHKYLGRKTGLLDKINVTAEYFAPELYGYLMVSMLVYYSDLSTALCIPVWGIVAWHFCFGTCAVLLGMPGGVGLMSVIPGLLIRYIVRLSVVIGSWAFILAAFEMLRKWR